MRFLQSAGRICCILAVGAVAMPFSGSSALEKKAETKDAPRVMMVVPLGAPAGATTRLTIRGQKLEGATAVRFQDARATTKILKKDKAPVPDKNPEKVGDTQLEIEVSLPPGIASGVLPFVVVTPAGESPAHSLLVESTLPVIAEKEPNNGFSQAQAIQVPQVVDGAISEPHDVDVFRFEGKAGQQLICEILAARHGSALDSILTLYDAAGHQLASNDDMEGSTDSRLVVTLGQAGSYFLVLQDAHDRGGPEHPYRLVVRPAK